VVNGNKPSCLLSEAWSNLHSLTSPSQHHLAPTLPATQSGEEALPTFSSSKTWAAAVLEQSKDRPASQACDLGGILKMQLRKYGVGFRTVR
jgi:hypothetical protein